MIAEDEILVYSYAARSVCRDDEWFLNSEERQRAAQFRFDKDRRLFVHGRRLARSVLADVTGADISSVRFRVTKLGKPELAGPLSHSGITFNLAHSGSQIVLAVACARHVGIDIEQEQPVANLLDLAANNFCATEVRLLVEADPDRRLTLFYKYWTLKEAYLKANGGGISVGLKALDASVIPDASPGLPRLPREESPRGIRVQRIAARLGYAAALAADGSVWKLQEREWADYSSAKGRALS